MARCDWAGDDPLYVEYHDTEWGVPTHDDRLLFEFIVLEGAQAGLSWITILRKRQGYKKAFDNFEMEKVARFTPKRIEKLLLNPDIVRNRQKVNSAVTNAQAALAVVEEAGSLSNYFWNWVDGVPVKNSFAKMSEIPAKTPLAESIAKDMKQRGFKFFGPTIAYAHMQATGLVNDHVTSCFRYTEV